VADVRRLYRRAMQRLTSALAVLGLTACGLAEPTTSPRTAAVSTWTDPNGLYSIDVTSPPVPRDVQELNGVGTINFKVYSIDDPPYSSRVTAFAYPGSSLAFDAEGELEHASGKAVARMGGQVTGREPVSLPGMIGLDLRFSVTSDDGGEGRGIARMLIAPAPNPKRYHAFCLAPKGADFAPCERFIQSLHPLSHAAT
jgi:hypothetical protein